MGIQEAATGSVVVVWAAADSGAALGVAGGLAASRVAAIWALAGEWEASAAAEEAGRRRVHSLSVFSAEVPYPLERTPRNTCGGSQTRRSSRIGSGYHWL